MKKLIIGITSLCLLLVAGTAVIASKVLEPLAKVSEKEDPAQ